MHYPHRFPYRVLLSLLFVAIAGCASIPSATDADSSPAAIASGTENPNLSEARQRASKHVTQGDEHLLAGSYDLAIDAFNTAIAIDPNFAIAYGRRGIARAALKDYPSALKDYNLAIKLEPSSIELYYNRGVAHANLQDYHSAIADFTIAIDSKPDFARAIGNRGFARASVEDYIGAIEDFQDAAEIFKRQGNGYAYQRMHNAIKYIRP